MKLNLVETDVHNIIEKAVENYALQIRIRNGRITLIFRQINSFV